MAGSFRSQRLFGGRLTARFANPGSCLGRGEDHWLCLCLWTSDSLPPRAVDGPAIDECARRGASRAMKRPGASGALMP